jgi:hypothetical protein
LTGLAWEIAIIEIKFFSFSKREFTLRAAGAIPIEIIAFNTIVVTEFLVSVDSHSVWSITIGSASLVPVEVLVTWARIIAVLDTMLVSNSTRVITSL